MMETSDNQYLKFTLAEACYAIPVSSVHEVLETASITRLPRSQKYVMGVVNLRGAVLPVIDLRIWLELPFCWADTKPSLIILTSSLRNETVLIGALVDSVEAVIEIEPSSIQRGDTLTRYGELRSLQGMGRCDEKFVAVLDPAFIFSSVSA